MMTNLDQYKAEVTPPKANAMINTFRAFGYNLQTAVADIVDNSISAQAKRIEIKHEWKGDRSYIWIKDDGKGMDLNDLICAMTPGSKDPKLEREQDDLGRFGLGLKTSSFSQCKVLTVISKKLNYQTIKRCWDLDYVNSTSEWSLLDYCSDISFSKLLDGHDQGTVVLWESLDRLIGPCDVLNEEQRKAFQHEMKLVEDHLGLVFHRYIDNKGIQLYINDREIKSRDPFLRSFIETQTILSEELSNEIKVKGFVLPHISKLTAEERRDNDVESWYKMQGFYIYRNQRLLLSGDWLGLFPKSEHCKNGRILIDIPNHLDNEWKIDIKKATAMPPVSIKQDLKRIGRLVRSQASQIYKYRGEQIRKEGAKFVDFKSVWKSTKRRDDTIDYKINEEHPVIHSLLESNTISRKDVITLLNLVSRTLPVDSIIHQFCEDPLSSELKDKKREPLQEEIEQAKKIYHLYITSGISDEIAKQSILNMEPFNEIPQIIETLK
ncbi:ATP-binding protein [Halosquirtibacter xylanolyticus]|uniref:ATP-binding protein n=1 Tax=Halosquirtibacter xylanolyticus TaxID=3374599 RepID=UPI0037485B53|nr:ATP-binding protein [Prolixibacteraceae bacterium]